MRTEPKVKLGRKLRHATNSGTETVNDGRKLKYVLSVYLFIYVFLYVCIYVFLYVCISDKREINTFLRPIPVRPSAVSSGSNDIPRRLSRFLLPFHQL